jgi:hypothetical protein
MTDITQRVGEVRSRHDLAAFVNFLARDLQQHGGDWENNNLPDFLQAMAAWIDDMDGYYTNVGKPMPEQPTWQTIAEILAASRILE